MGAVARGRAGNDRSETDCATAQALEVAAAVGVMVDAVDGAVHGVADCVADAGLSVVAVSVVVVAVEVLVVTVAGLPVVEYGRRGMIDEKQQGCALAVALLATGLYLSILWVVRLIYG